ncbi:MAG: class I SAM-dependent methyltransferase [Candidatus Tectomicrobia bacterium]|nr:class I SAM-dependent methyltransferase [Candidatus Tectomicrobia bacterium]
MTGGDRLRREREFHERRSGERSGRLSGAELRFEDSLYLDHETWVRDTFALLGDLRGKRVLDYGAGEGLSSVVLARRGARVVSFDIASGNVRLTARRAAANGVPLHLAQMAGEALAFRDGAFDAVYGNAILHHVNLERAGAELRRVLRPGGVAVFSEPWGENPVLEFVRRRVPYRGKDRTPDERPLGLADVARLRAQLPLAEVRGYQLLSMIRRQVRWRPLISLLEGADALLLGLFPGLWRWCRYAVIILRKEGA